MLKTVVCVIEHFVCEINLSSYNFQFSCLCRCNSSGLVKIILVEFGTIFSDLTKLSKFFIRLGINTLCTKLCKLLDAWFFGHQSAVSEFRDCFLLLQSPRWYHALLNAHLQAGPESW
jgi:hypothetical protein